MPEFDVSTWDNFKQQFLSVIQWIFYAFRLIYDNALKHPLLYAFLFFPIFAVAFITIFHFIVTVVPFHSLLDGSDVNTDNSLFKNLSATNNREVKARNLSQIVSHQSRGAVKENPLGSVKTNSFGSVKSNSFGSVKSNSFSSVGSSSSPSLGSGAMSPSFGGAGTSMASAINQSIKGVQADKKAKQKEIEANDRAMNMQTNYYSLKDDDGNDVQAKEVVNKRTGEVVSLSETVKYD